MCAYFLILVVIFYFAEHRVVPLESSGLIRLKFTHSPPTLSQKSLARKMFVSLSTNRLFAKPHSLGTGFLALATNWTRYVCRIFRLPLVTAHLDIQITICSRFPSSSPISRLVVHLLIFLKMLLISCLFRQNLLHN